MLHIYHAWRWKKVVWSHVPLENKERCRFTGMWVWCWLVYICFPLLLWLYLDHLKDFSFRVRDVHCVIKLLYRNWTFYLSSFSKKSITPSSYVGARSSKPEELSCPNLNSCMLWQETCGILCSSFFHSMSLGGKSNRNCETIQAHLQKFC